MLAIASQLPAKVRALVSDPLYRGTLLLLINQGLLSVLGFVFWALAAREYPASTVGSFSGLSSGIGLVSAIASLGLQNLVTRHIASSSSPRGLMVLVMGSIASLGGTLCAVVVLAFGPHLPAALHLQQHGKSAALFTALVITNALCGVLNAGLVAIRAPWAVLWTNLVGAVARLVALFALASLDSYGLILSYGLGLFLSTALSVPPLVAKTAKGHAVKEAIETVRGYLATTIQNYIATIFGIAPSAIVPLIIIAELGAAATAPYSVAALISGFLNVIPSTVAGVLFAEVSRHGVTMTVQLRKAIRAIYSLMIPLLVVIVLAAPYILQIFGPTYAEQGTSTLRILSVASLASAGNYLVDSMLIARDRGAAYLFMNVANAVFAFTGVGVLLSHGLTGGSIGWAASQVASLVLGLAVIVMGRSGRHRHGVVGTTTTAPEKATSSQDGTDYETTIDTSAMLSLRLSAPDLDRELLSEDLTATRPFRGLLMEGRNVRLAAAGEVVYLGILVPTPTIETHLGRVRPSLPFIVAISGYSGWLSALFIPTLRLPDLLAGFWETLDRLGGLPRRLVWDGYWLTSNCADLFTSLGTNVTVADDAEQKLISATYRYLTEEFFRSRSVASVEELNSELAKWLQADNSVPVRQSQEDRLLVGIERVLLSIADRQAMQKLPPRPNQCIWQLEFMVRERPFVYFEKNYYEVDPIFIGERVRVVADLNHVRVRHGDRDIAIYRRSWGEGRTCKLSSMIQPINQNEAAW